MPDSTIYQSGGSSKSATDAQALGGCDTIVAGSQAVSPMFRLLAIRRTSQGFEVVHRYAGEWLGVSYPACVRKSLTQARADHAAHMKKDADRKRDRGV